MDTERKDFIEYLAIKPGTTIKIISDIDVVGYAPKVVADAVKDVEQHGTTGILTYIDKDTVSIREINASPNERPISFGPRAVKRIEIINAAEQDAAANP